MVQSAYQKAFSVFVKIQVNLRTGVDDHYLEIITNARALIQHIVINLFLMFEPFSPDFLIDFIIYSLMNLKEEVTLHVLSF